MCKFCETSPSRTIHDGKYHYFYEDYIISMHLLDDYGAADAFCTLKLNYCPICGKKLNEE